MSGSKYNSSGKNLVLGNVTRLISSEVLVLLVLPQENLTFKVILEMKTLDYFKILATENSPSQNVIYNLH